MAFCTVKGKVYERVIIPGEEIVRRENEMLRSMDGQNKE